MAPDISKQSSNSKQSPKENGTFAYQSSLPRLPIPSLESTCNKYLAALSPLQTPKEHADTKAAVRDFLRHQGPELQDKLLKYSKDKANYIEQFWYDSYLNFDNPVVLNLNPFFLFEDDPTPARNSQVDRASSLVISALAFVRAVRREELEPDKIRNTPLDMYQYSRLFGTARIPTDQGCQISQDPESKHIVVMCHGQFYWFDVLDSNSDIIMTQKDLAVNLASIIADAADVPIASAAKGALGILSTENRKTWSHLRDLLNATPNNADCLSIVDSALFVVCLDVDSSPTTPKELCTSMLCGTSTIERGVQVGTCMNRWYDKLQIIVCENGSAGINFEHTGVDGHTVLRFASDIYADTILRFAKSVNGHAPSLWASTSPDPSKRDPDELGDVHTVPHKLEWDLSPELRTALRFAESRLADLIGQNEFAILEFSTYGKSFITSHGMSPDAYVQMAYQAAYFGLYGKSESVYEPAMTKTFYHGRTEAVRSVTTDSDAFVRTFWGDNPPEQKIAALKKACVTHTNITREAAKGQGHDRHLYALWCIWQHDIDELSDDSPGEDSTAPEVTKTLPLNDLLATMAIQSTRRSPNRDKNLSKTRSPSQSSGNILHQANIPVIFADSGWEKITTTILSTSNCGNPALRLLGFGPTSAQGFGLGYIIKDGSISICASSKHRQTGRYIESLRMYLLEMHRLLRSAAKANGAKEATTNGLWRHQQREAEQEKQDVKERVKSRGRSVLDGKMSASLTENGTLVDGEEAKAEDDLGGYGFFDAGILTSTLVPKEDEEGTSQKAIHRRNIGRMLRIAEY